MPPPAADSPGMKAITNSGERSNCFQYSFLASWSTCVRSWRACLSSRARRCCSSSASENWRKASSGTLESITTSPPPGRWTIMSGRTTPSSVAADFCSSKSQCSIIPAASTARRSVISPQRPRVCGRAQRRHQVPRLLLQLLVPEVQRRHPLAEAGVGTLALDLHLLEAALVARQRLAERVQQLRDRLLALGRGRPGPPSRASLSFVSASARNCSLFLASARADSSANVPASRARSSSARTIASASTLPQQVELGSGDRPGRLRRRRRLRCRLQLRRLLGDDGLCVRQPALGNACCSDQAGAAHQVQGNADRQSDGEPERPLR